MNITFLIGNGFDRNLGLDTTYSNFVEYYKKITPKTDTLKNFHSYIKGNEELWSSAEIAMGKYTGQLEKGAAEAFSECHINFCEELAKYLKGQMNRIDYSDSQENVLTAFSNLNNIIQSFPTQERERLQTLYNQRNNEPIVFNFICYNYTDTLDQCIAIVKKDPATLGSHKNGNQTLNHSIGQLLHVHGTVDKEMVFGVNDDSQIEKIDVFDCEDGDIRKNMLIKIQANASFLENTDTIASKLVQNSNIIYIYGMSIGETDKLWWDRICTWLNNNGERHLIIQNYGMPARTVMQLPYQLEERKAKRNITKYSSLDDTKKRNIETRIHITGENIFLPIHDIARDPLYEKYVPTLEQIKYDELYELAKETVQV